MQAMLIEDHPAAAVHAAALSEAGFAVAVTGSLAQAKATLRDGVVDVLVLGETVGGRLSHDVALLAELRNPGLGTILLSDRRGEAVEELFDLLPSLHAVLGPATPTALLAQIAVAAAESPIHSAGAEAPEDRDEAPEPAAAVPADTPPLMPPPAAAPRSRPPLPAFLLAHAAQLRAPAVPAPACAPPASASAARDLLAAWRSEPARQRRLHLA